MRLICAPKGYKFKSNPESLEVVLYGHADRQTRGSAGEAAKDGIIDANLSPAPKAWDFLSLALAVIAADLAGHRTRSPDGWTREFQMEVAVVDPAFWNGQSLLVNRLLAFLTTDIWDVSFIEGGFLPKPPAKPLLPAEDYVALLSGGLDSLIGVLDLVAQGTKPFVVSQTVRGDAENQRAFAKAIGGGLRHLQVNHNTDVPDPESPPSQRARSLIFIAYGILASTTLNKYRAGGAVTLYVCENGFISVNPPLTDMRLGSLSTRTTHPAFLKLIEELLDNAGLHISVQNPYQLKTKGEMLRDCADKKLRDALASTTTSCGRFLQHGYKHCGRCVPCLVRRAAFRSAGMSDGTKYVFEDLGRDDDAYAGFDDVRSVAMALAEVQSEGLENWLGTALSMAQLGDIAPLQGMVGRALDELGALLTFHGVK
jgi:hypothetical protein